MLVNAIIFNIILMLSGSIVTLLYLSSILINKCFIPEVLSIIISLSIFSYISGFIISIYASNTNCKKINKIKAILEGFRNSIYAIIGVLLVYYLKIVREPFLELFSNKLYGKIFAYCFIIILNTTISVIINYYTSIDKSCKIPQKDIEKKLKKLDKYLNKRPSKKTKIMIPIKD